MPSGAALVRAGPDEIQLAVRQPSICIGPPSTSACQPRSQSADIPDVIIHAWMPPNHAVASCAHLRIQKQQPSAGHHSCSPRLDQHSCACRLGQGETLNQSVSGSTRYKARMGQGTPGHVLANAC